MFEINLVPDAKAELVEAQKSRNLVVFVCTVVCIVSVAFVVLSFLFKLTQDVTIGSQDTHLKALSSKLKEYDGLDEILTIQNQLNTVEELKNNKNVISRVFMLLQSFMPTGTDEVTISDMTVDLENYTLDLSGQTVAGVGTDGINSRVLESFQKQIGMMKYDYGRYVTEKGNEIPTWCINEADENGIPYVEGINTLYAVWRKGTKGCNPDVENKNEGSDYSADKTIVSLDEEEISQEALAGMVDEAAGEQVKIYRTPLFDQWDNGRIMTSDGTISGVAHFESKCIKYTKGNDGKWSSYNDCLLAEGDLELTSNPTNGRQEDGSLVLKFEGRITFNPEVFAYENKHVVAIAPSGRANVTDSYVQIEQIFDERALDCDKDDAECRSGK